MTVLSYYWFSWNLRNVVTTVPKRNIFRHRLIKNFSHSHTRFFKASFDQTAFSKHFISGQEPVSDLGKLDESEGMEEQITKNIYEHTVIIFITDTFIFSESSNSLNRLAR